MEELYQTHVPRSQYDEISEQLQDLMRNLDELKQACESLSADKLNLQKQLTRAREEKDAIEEASQEYKLKL